VKIVRFKDGKYAVRRWFFGYEYLDLAPGWQHAWRTKTNHYFGDCLTNDLEHAKRMAEFRNDNGTPIDAARGAQPEPQPTQPEEAGSATP
jgi:ferritin